MVACLCCNVFHGTDYHIYCKNDVIAQIIMTFNVQVRLATHNCFLLE
jgi:hypothetical protein